jgi:hypothetical protein
VFLGVVPITAPGFILGHQRSWEVDPLLVCTGVVCTVGALAVPVGAALVSRGHSGNSRVPS